MSEKEEEGRLNGSRSRLPVIKGPGTYGQGSTVAKIYCQDSNNHELKEGFLSGWLRASPALRSSSEQMLPKYLLGHS